MSITLEFPFPVRISYPKVPMDGSIAIPSSVSSTSHGVHFRFPALTYSRTDTEWEFSLEILATSRTVKETLFELCCEEARTQQSSPLFAELKFSNLTYENFENSFHNLVAEDVISYWRINRGEVGCFNYSFFGYAPGGYCYFLRHHDYERILHVPSFYGFNLDDFELLANSSGVSIGCEPLYVHGTGEFTLHVNDLPGMKILKAIKKVFRLDLKEVLPFKTFLPGPILRGYLDELSDSCDKLQREGVECSIKWSPNSLLDLSIPAYDSLELGS